MIEESTTYKKIIVKGTANMTSDEKMKAYHDFLPPEVAPRTVNGNLQDLQAAASYRLRGAAQQLSAAGAQSLLGQIGLDDAAFRQGFSARGLR